MLIMSKATYSENNNNINTIFWDLQTGTTINFNNKFLLGLFAKKSITPVQKSSSKYYWQQLNFQISIFHSNH